MNPIIIIALLFVFLFVPIIVFAQTSESANQRIPEEIWQYREHERLSEYPPDYTFTKINSGTKPLHITSTVTGAGDAYVFKTFKKSEIENHDIKIEWSGTSPIISGVNQWSFIVVDGAYDRTSFEDFPINVFRIDKGAGNLGLLDLQIVNFESQIDTLRPNWAVSQLDDVTLFVRVTDSGIQRSITGTVNSIEIVGVAKWIFTDPVITAEQSGSLNDYGTYSSTVMYVPNTVTVISDESSCESASISGTWNGIDTCTVTSLIINSGDIITINSGIHLVNNGTLTNHGIINNDGELVNFTDHIILNFGIINNNSEGIINTYYATNLTNSGTIHNDGFISNTGFTDNSGIINNKSSGKFGNFGVINNNSNGVINNYGNINNPYDPITVNNTGRINNSGTFNNYGIIDTSGTITNSRSIINNTGIINNSGTITNPTDNNVFESDRCVNEMKSTYLSDPFTGKGKINGMCWTNASILVGVDVFKDDQIKIMLPKKILSDLRICTPKSHVNSLFVLLDNEEVHNKVILKKIDYDFVLNMTKGTHIIELLGLANFESPSLQCLSPKLQQERFGSDNVLCQDDLIRIEKISNGSIACVKPETQAKLFERGWSHETSTILQSVPQDLQKTWVEIDPMQCLWNPWEKDWLKSHNDDYASYPRDFHTEGFDGGEITIIKEYYKNQGIIVYDVKLELTHYSVCEACACPIGDTLYLLVSDNAIRQMLESGFKVSENQSR